MDKTRIYDMLTKVYYTKPIAKGEVRRLTRNDLIQLSNQLARFTVPTKVRINQAFLDMLIKDGAIQYSEGRAETFGSFTGLLVEIDNSIPTFKFDYK